ncbi:hypothetical protein DEO72_LG3g2109 [Vigna unguiculata]|uniref:Uncharacterized protein n=1 Tax=Vigna unguiculata TaxID=3917 RepID=A0A4D6LG07_VIGUN|nr:hypothetical protein DEO72_LG3g2109 [Vigna unguiculata]
MKTLAAKRGCLMDWYFSELARTAERIGVEISCGGASKEQESFGVKDTSNSRFSKDLRFMGFYLETAQRQGPSRQVSGMECRKGLKTFAGMEKPGFRLGTGVPPGGAMLAAKRQRDAGTSLDMRLGMGVIGGCKNNNWCVADTAPGGLKVCARREELQGGFCNNWHLAVRWDPPGGRGAVNVLLRQTIVLQIMTCGGSYPVTLAWGYERGRFVCSVLTLERCYVRGGMGLVDHMCWTTSSSPFLFLYGDDRVIRYTGADIDTCDVDDAQATE